jgi:hypothetical protein
MTFIEADLFGKVHEWLQRVEASSRLRDAVVGCSLRFVTTVMRSRNEHQRRGADIRCDERHSLQCVDKAAAHAGLETTGRYLLLRELPQDGRTGAKSDTATVRWREIAATRA